MKKLLLIAGIALFSTTFFFSSCTDDEEPQPSQPPSINFLTGSDLISSDATVTVNGTFKIKVYAEENADSKSNLRSLEITRVFNLNSWDTTFTYNDPNLTAEINFTAQPVAGVENITFEVTDNDGQKASISVKITTEEATGGPIRTFTMKILGSYQSTTGSSFASIDGSVYNLAEAKANSANVDFLYWWGATTSATIGAPDDVNAATVYNNPTNGIPTWDTKNPTRFKTTTVTGAEFDAYGDDTEIIAIATGADQTRTGSLAVGNVIAFMTASGKYGVIKVTDIVAGADGQITIDVKVQE
jgi:hypothetical protein